MKEENNNEHDTLEEHNFIAICLKIGLRIEDLKQLQYKDVAKIILCYTRENRETQKTRKATQKDIDKFLR